MFDIETATNQEIESAAQRATDSGDYALADEYYAVLMVRHELRYYQIMHAMRLQAVLMNRHDRASEIASKSISYCQRAESKKAAQAFLVESARKFLDLSHRFNFDQTASRHWSTASKQLTQAAAQLAIE